MKNKTRKIPNLTRRDFLKVFGLVLPGTALAFLRVGRLPRTGNSPASVTPTVEYDDIMQDLLAAQLEAPSESSAVALRDYLNTNAVGDRVVAMPTYPETGQIEVAWSPNEQRWLPVEGNPDTDPTGRSLPELFEAGRTYRNYQDEADPRNGADAVADIVSGEEKILERIQLPGLEKPVSMAEFVQLGRKRELQIQDKFGQMITGLDMFGYAHNMMVNAYKFPSAESKIGKYFRGINSEEYFVMPVVLEKGSADENGEPRSTVYAAPFFYSNQKGNENLSVPAAGVHYHQTPTYTVLTPIVDGQSGRLAAWMRVHLGADWGTDVNTTIFSQSDNVAKFDNVAGDSPKFFGNEPKDNVGKYTFGLILREKTTAAAFGADHSGLSLLEDSPGILAEDELSELMETQDAAQAIQFLAASQARLAVLEPKFYFYPRA